MVWFFRFKYHLVFLFFSAHFCFSAARAQVVCFDIFNQSTLEIKAKVETLNRLDLLEDVILVYDSPLLTAIKNNSFAEAFKAVQNLKVRNKNLVFFDEINISIALGSNRIAVYLFEHSSFDFVRTPLRNDLLMSATFFNNPQMLNYLMLQKKIKFSRPSKYKALRWAADNDRQDISALILANEAHINLP